MTTAPGYSPPKRDAGGDDPGEVRQHAREIAAWAFLASQGKLNATASLTLATGTTTTTFTDSRLTPNSAVLFDPVTASAATELAAGTMYTLTANRNGKTWTVTHSSSATTDRTFRVLIIG